MLPQKRACDLDGLVADCFAVVHVWRILLRMLVVLVCSSIVVREFPGAKALCGVADVCFAMYVVRDVNTDFYVFGE